MVRERLVANMRAGVSPEAAMRDIVGRFDPSQQRRVGGILGLNEYRLQQVDRALDELRSGDPARMQNYLRRSLRDRRSDSIVRRAIREGRAVPADDARRIAARYADRHLARRGRDIARTELLQSLHAAQDEGLLQLVDRGAITQQQVTRTWDSSEDSATRDSHRAMDGQTVTGVDQPFRTGAGYLMRHPGDSSLGAPASEIINCRCRVSVSVDHLAALAG